MNLLASLNWRYAAKKFDTTKKVSNENIETLKEAIRLSASSFGLQTYKVLIIEDEALKQKLVPASYNQQQVGECSHLFVFCNNISVGDNEIDEYINLIGDIRKIDTNNLAGFGDFMKTTINRFPAEFQETWTSKQTYLAAGNLLAAAGELKIDSCPMEGFDAKQYDEILELSKQNLNVSLIVPVGYRSATDENQHLAKVRKSKENLFTTI